MDKNDETYVVLIMSEFLIEKKKNGNGNILFSDG